MRDLIEVTDGTLGSSVVRGMRSPVPGLAITEPVRDDDEFGSAVVTHLLTGHGIGWFLSAEAAAGFIIAISGLTDWTTFDIDADDYHDVMVAVIAAQKLWGGEGKLGHGVKPGLNRRAG